MATERRGEGPPTQELTGSGSRRPLRRPTGECAAVSFCGVSDLERARWGWNGVNPRIGRRLGIGTPRFVG